MTQQALEKDLNSITLSLVLPCYNEAEHIQGSVPDIIDVLDTTSWAYEIIFVEDVSQDNTRELLQSLIEQYPDHNLSAIYHEQNTGRGRAAQDGIRQAVGEIVGYIDIDLEISPIYIIPCVLEILKGADLATAQRIYKIQLTPNGLFRHMMSQVYSWFVRTTLNIPFRDTETGCKFFSKQAANMLMDYTEDQKWFWDTEVMTYAHTLGMTTTELPSLFIRRQDKTSTVKPFRDTKIYLQNLSKFSAKLKDPMLQERVAKSKKLWEENC